MFDDKIHKFLFKCDDCDMIVSIELEDEEDLIKVNEDLFVLECPCGSKSHVLRD
jgi:hypothetical protein